jgi:acyl-CoA synthetase (NDP forming)
VTHLTSRQSTDVAEDEGTGRATDTNAAGDSAPVEHLPRPTAVEGGGREVAPAAAIDRMFHPRGVALLGVSGRAGNIMGRPLRYLVEHGFQGGIYPINPRYDELEGKRCYPSLADVPGPVDLVLVLLPSDQAVDAIHQAGAAGASAAVVFASGFAEVGPEGAALQRSLAEAGRQAGVRVLGPNCQGMLYAPTGLTATFTAAADRPLPHGDGVAYVGQSGAVGGSILDLATEMGLALTAWVSTGNQADLGLVEIASVLLDDAAVHVVMLYIEAIGDGTAYARLARKARDADKRLVVLASGRSSAGRRAAASHTGSMLGDDVGFVLTSRRYNVVLVDDIDELLAVAATLATMPAPEGRRLAVVTTSGGAGSLAADRCEDHHVELPELTTATQDRLRPLIPDFGALANPVDVTAQLFNRGAQAFGDVCRIVADDPGVDAVAVLLTMVVGEPGARLAEDLVATAASLSKPLLIAWLAGRQLTVEGREIFREAGVPVFSTIGALAKAAGSIAPAHHRGTPPASLAGVPTLDTERVTRLVNVAGEVDGPALLEAIGVAQPTSVLVASAAEAEAAVARLGAPAAMKLQAGALAHKSDVGGVRLGVQAAGAGRVHDELCAAAAAHHVQDLHGVLVQEMVPAGTEIIIGATAGRDGFPPVVTVGLGGVATELYRDVASGLAPVTPADAWSMLRSLRAWPLLAGFRGAPPGDVDKAVDAIVRVSHAAVAAGGRLLEFEINPLIVAPRGGGAVAVDVLVRTAGGTSAVAE